jgi:long-chain acyl-CoA synthetase
VNIAEKIYQQADRNAVALIDDDRALTYGRLFGLADAAAASLAACGALKTAGVPRIGLCCPNGAAHVILALAIVRSGGCLVPVACELSPCERDALALSTGLHAVVAAEGAAWNPGVSARKTDMDASGVRAAVLTGLRERNPVPLSFDEGRLSELNPAFIRFSSGTTGQSKGVVLSHQTLLDRIATANQVLRVTPRDRIVWMLPMAHHFAVSIMLYLMNGATTVVVGSHLAGDVLAAARNHGGTVVYGSPFHHALLAGEASGLPWPGLRLAVSTAASLPLATARAFDARFGIPLSQALGLIEAGLPLVNVDAPREKPESVGRPAPGFDIETRLENGRAAAPGETGELFLRGPGMLDAYLSPWRLRAEILERGWFRTGDLATVDAEGAVRLCGRSRSVINVAGMKCFPEEIEAVLCKLPQIRAARVFAKTHPQFGAVPVAELVPEAGSTPPGIAAIVAHCRNELARFKIPVEYHFVESLPMTASGKIKR